MCVGVIGRMLVEQKFDVLALSETKLNGKGAFVFGCEWKYVRCDQREGSGLNGESGSETMCGGVEKNVIMADVGASKVW